MSDIPDTDQILTDIERAQARVHDFLRELSLDPEAGPEFLAEAGPEFLGRMANAVDTLLDQWAYLRHCIETEHAPLPGPWAMASQVNSPLGDLCEEAWGVIANAGWDDDAKSPGWQEAATRWRGKWFAVLNGANPEPEAEAVERPAGWDAAWEQLEHLRKAAGAVQVALDSPATSPAEFAAKAEHLVACVSAVDVMCSTGDLPADWALPFWRRRVIESATWQDGLSGKADEMGVDPRHPAVEVALADPRVTANGAAAAVAGWDIAGAAGATLGWARVELMGHRVVAGVVSEVTLFGRPMVRIDFPGKGRAAEFYEPGALYGLTPLPGQPRVDDPVVRDDPEDEPGDSEWDPYCG